ncbi:hypothetical protein VP01_844g1 [Puccinia sorghi]|uniref:Uncharacterized protein n=1 Tax=Puccinia sorghi TaxID=27349 RepID=A0A0L6U9E1_9BASI|nr:hypothetical protein VP01_844g1 [Puccinia sorghi]
MHKPLANPRIPIKTEQPAAVSLSFSSHALYLVKESKGYYQDYVCFPNSRSCFLVSLHTKIVCCSLYSLLVQVLIFYSFSIIGISSMSLSSFFFFIFIQFNKTNTHYISVRKRKANHTFLHVSIPKAICCSLCSLLVQVCCGVIRFYLISLQVLVGNILFQRNGGGGEIIIWQPKATSQTLLKVGKDSSVSLIIMTRTDNFIVSLGCILSSLCTMARLRNKMGKRRTQETRAKRLKSNRNDFKDELFSLEKSSLCLHVAYFITASTGWNESKKFETSVFIIQVHLVSQQVMDFFQTYQSCNSTYSFLSYTSTSWDEMIQRVHEYFFYNIFSFIQNLDSFVWRLGESPSKLLLLIQTFSKITVPKNLHMQTGGVWMAAWLKHTACQLKAVGQVFFAVISSIYNLQNMLLIEFHLINMEKQLNNNKKSIQEIMALNSRMICLAVAGDAAKYIYIFIMLSHHHKNTILYNVQLPLNKLQNYRLLVIDNLFNINVKKKKIQAFLIYHMEGSVPWHSVRLKTCENHSET